MISSSQLVLSQQTVLLVLKKNKIIKTENKIKNHVLQFAGHA